MADIDFSGVFDFDTADTGAEEQEVAEPADVDAVEENTDGAEEQEVAEPAREQTAEENARYASIRREAERKAQEKFRLDSDRIRNEAMSEAANIIKGLGMVNPYTGQVVQTVEDMKAYADAMAKEQREQAESKMKESGLSEEDINAMILSRPEVQEAIKAKSRLEALERDVQQRQSKQVFDEELAAIQKFDPEVKNFEDLMNNEHRDDFIALVKRGYRISDAYFIVNKDTIMQRNSESSKQEAVNAMRGKEHLEKSSSRGDGGINVPADVIAQYQALNPNKSVDEIRAFVARDMKRIKKKN